MPTTPGLIPEVTINGQFGELRDELGIWLTNVQQVDGRIMNERQEIRPAGQRGVGYKLKGVTGDGTIRQFKVTSQFLERISRVMRSPRSGLFVGELILKLDDVEALGVERIRLARVKMWEINFGWTVNEIVEESIPFTFEGLDFLDQIVGDPTRPAVGRV